MSAMHHCTTDAARMHGVGMPYAVCLQCPIIHNPPSSLCNNCLDIYTTFAVENNTTSNHVNTLDACAVAH